MKITINNLTTNTLRVGQVLQIPGEVEEDIPSISENDNSYTKEKEIVLKSYNKVRLIYDVVNSQFKVSSDEQVIMNDKVYKRITNFDDITNGVFTLNGINKYINEIDKRKVLT